MRNKGKWLAKGLRNKHGQVDASVSLKDRILTGTMDKGNAVDIIYLDFSKAFDKIPYDIFIKKLFNCGWRAQLDSSQLAG